MTRLNDPDLDVGKIVLMGDQGEGKTGAKAALVCLGYTLLTVDTDKGFKILKSLLTDPHYPYAAYLKKVGIDPSTRVSFKQVDIPMDFQSETKRGVSWDVLSPTSSAAWNYATHNLLKEWIDEDGTNYGGLGDWGPNIVLDYDTLSTLAEISKYWVQDMNNRRGSLEDEYGRDSAGAQEMISRLARKLTASAVRCNVIVTTHVTQVVTDRGAAENPGARLRQNPTIRNLPTDPRGYPALVGRATSAIFGKYWNDMFVVKRDGEGRNAERRIYTNAVSNINTKNSVWLEESYPISTGLGEIFYALQYKEPPMDFIEAVRGKQPAGDKGQDRPTRPSTGGFGNPRS